MRIAVLTNEYEPDTIGGLGTVSTRLAEEWSRAGHEVTVLTKWRGSDVDDRLRAGVRVIRFPRDSEYQSVRMQVFYADPIVQYVESRVAQLDAIHVHSLQTDALAQALSKHYGAIYVYTCHSLIASEGSHTARHRAMEARQVSVMAAADAVVAPSLWEQRMIREMYRDQKTPVYVIPNGVTCATYERQPRPGSLLYAGRVIRTKGIDDLLHAIRLVSEKYPVKLDIRGTGSPSYLKHVEQTIRRLRMRESIRLLGKCDHATLQRRMGDYHAVILPSRAESFGLVALEAMAAGTPLITTRAGGLRDFVDESVATVIDSSDVSGIARAIVHALKHRRKTEKRRLKALERAKRYTWTRVAEQYIHRMQALLADS